MAFCIRYSNGLCVEERFLGLIKVSKNQNSESLTSAIFSFIESCNLNSVPTIAQSYDGAAVMSDNKNGVQSKVHSKHPEAIYIHCMAHKLNLVVVDTCKNIKVFLKSITYNIKFNITI